MAINLYPFVLEAMIMEGLGGPYEAVFRYQPTHRLLLTQCGPPSTLWFSYHEPTGGYDTFIQRMEASKLSDNRILIDMLVYAPEPRGEVPTPDPQEQSYEDYVRSLVSFDNECDADNAKIRSWLNVLALDVLQGSDTTKSSPHATFAGHIRAPPMSMFLRDSAPRTPKRQREEDESDASDDSQPSQKRRRQSDVHKPQIGDSSHSSFSHSDLSSARILTRRRARRIRRALGYDMGQEPPSTFSSRDILTWASANAAIDEASMQWNTSTKASKESDDRSSATAYPTGRVIGFAVVSLAMSSLLFARSRLWGLL